MEDEKRKLERILAREEEPGALKYFMLQDITGDFSGKNVIGNGGFATVYKGEFNGGNFVAVKKIHVHSRYNKAQKKAHARELESLLDTNKTKHDNIVYFLGYCFEKVHEVVNDKGKRTPGNLYQRLFCFEYISNGSLDRHITDELRGLDWETRYEIITQICEGLCYLHGNGIMHLDLKPGNILLDFKEGRYIPKITDFGLSIPSVIPSTNDTPASSASTVTNAGGTLGYWAPEYKPGSSPTYACDIYSLGATIMKLVTGTLDPTLHKYFSENEVEAVQYNVLRRWRHRWREIDGCLTPKGQHYHQIVACIDIAWECTKEAAGERPNIKKIIDECLTKNFEDTGNKMRLRLEKDEMLSIRPLDMECLQAPNNPKSETRCVTLKNNSENRIAFRIVDLWERFTLTPKEGILDSRENARVKVTLLSSEAYKDDIKSITVQSRSVHNDFAVEDITESTFSAGEGDGFVDEVDVNFVYVVPKEEQPDMELLQAKRIKTGGSSQKTTEDTDTTTGCVLHTPASFARRYATDETYLGHKSDRAIDHARGAMGSVLHKLAKLAIDGYGLEPSTQKEIKTLSEILVNVCSELPDREELSTANKIWMDELRELSYKIDDMLDSFLVHVKPDSRGSSGFQELACKGLRIWKNGLMDQKHIVDVIKYIKGLVVDVAKGKPTQFNFKQDSARVDKKAIAKKAAIEELRSSPGRYQSDTDLVGIDEQRDKVKRYLHLTEENLRIVSIIGMGGLGKTTLAMAVYAQLNGYSPKIRISVGHNPDEMQIEAIFRGIIFDCKIQENPAKNRDKIKKELKSLRKEQLANELRILLTDKRYLAVIDDIWERTTWNIIFSAFPTSNRGSRVITTSRGKEVVGGNPRHVAKIIYRIGKLSREDSRILFSSTLLDAPEDPDDPEKYFVDTDKTRKITVKILDRCDGVPLAIISVARLLAGAQESTWMYVWESMKAMNKDLEVTGQILDFSYKHLPDHLKTCMLYVSMYREDCEIDKIELLRQWVAEGLVSAEGVLDAVDVAEEYFKRLLNMCMIHPGKIDYNKEVLSCRVHDLVLGILRSRSSDVKFSHVIDCFEDMSGQIRRVSVQSKKEDRAKTKKRRRKKKKKEEDKRIIEKNKGSDARSFKLDRGFLLPNVLSYKLVRVLHLEHKEYSKRLDLSAIGMLLLLRYLKIECYVLSESKLKLPDKIGHLRHLETLDIVGGVLKSYPSDIVSLPWLSYLRYRGWKGIVLPDGVGRLKSLHTLAGVCVYGSTVDNINGLGKLAKLRKLHISSDRIVSSEAMTALHSSISELSSKLEVFILGEDSIIILEAPISWDKTPFPTGSRIRELDLGYCNFGSCPAWVGELTSLYKFTIRVKKVDNSLKTVSVLPSLAYFRLLTGTEREEEKSVVIPGGQGAFQSLKHLIFSCPMASLTFEAGALPNLEKLGMMFRYHMTHELLPAGLNHLPATTLKEIRLSVESTEEPEGSEDWEEEDFYKYMDTKEYEEASIQQKKKVRPLLKKEFDKYHPDAHIDIIFE